MSQDAVSPELVAGAILKVVRSDGPDFRNIVGEDAKSIWEARSMIRNFKGSWKSNLAARARFMR